MKILLTDQKPSMNPTAQELSSVILARIGLQPRKRGSTEKMFSTFLEFYERSKKAAREKHPEDAVITVEEMALFAGISRQTMYEYLRRWLDLQLIEKTSYIKDTKVIVGYRLNGSTLEEAFGHMKASINRNVDDTIDLVNELQRIVKNEKISNAQKERKQSNAPFVTEVDNKPD